MFHRAMKFFHTFKRYVVQSNASTTPGSLFHLIIFIPIFSGMKNKRRKKEQRRRSSRDRRGDYYEDSGSGSPHGPREGPREARYNDMAPK